MTLFGREQISYFVKARFIFYSNTKNSNAVWKKYIFKNKIYFFVKESVTGICLHFFLYKISLQYVITL